MHSLRPLLSVLVALCGSAAFAQRVQLVNQPLTVDVPKGFVDTSWQHTSEGFPLYFNVPEDKDGGRSAYPEISMYAASEVDGSEVTLGLSEFAKRRIDGLRTVIPPRIIKIAGRRAIEFAVSGDLILHFSGGGISKSSLITHEIVIEDDSRLYRCKMNIEPRNYVTYIKVFHEFCNSARFRSA